MKEFIKSIFAGIMIGIAGLLSANIATNWVGACLFTVGLIVICFEDYNLYTGKIGFVNSFRDVLQCGIYILGNAIGVALIALSAGNNAVITTLVVHKLELNLFTVFIKAFWCGFLMYLAVDIFKKYKSIIGIALCIPAFILCGFDHSIADMFYFFNAGATSLYAFLFLLIVLIGNALGALSHRILCLCDKENQK